MKAKEMIRLVTNPDWAGNHMVGTIVFTEEEFALFWDQLCKEQRELCVKNSLTELDLYLPNIQGVMESIVESIRNAPTPNQKEE